MRWSRPLQGTPKTVTLSKEADGWYVSLLLCRGARTAVATVRQGDGHRRGAAGLPRHGGRLVVENPRHHRRGEKKLAKAQRRVSRRQRGSHRRRKAVACLARAHQAVRRQRADFHHKTALALLRAYDTIYLEDLQVANLLRNRRLAKSIGDAGWARFRAILEAKAACAGRRVVAVPPAYTSQDCSGCGTRVPKSLSVRTHVCPTCGLVLDRDENAARNIQWRGQRLRGLAEVSAGTNREPMGL